MKIILYLLNLYEYNNNDSCYTGISTNGKLAESPDHSMSEEILF